MNNKDAPSAETRPTSRREALALMAGASAAMATGCCELRGFAKPGIGPKSVALMERRSAAFLAPQSINTDDVPNPCVDVHAHFFNASDVTIKGYIAGPVAHSMGDGVLGKLVQLLAPIADALGEIAPTASAEYQDLAKRGVAALTDADQRAAIQQARQKERETLSVEFNKLAQSRKGREFRKEYERLMNDGPGVVSERRVRVRRIDEESVLKAMDLSEAPVDLETVSLFATTDRAQYAEGLLAFVGYMMSSRYSNLLTYQAAFTEKRSTNGGAPTIGVTRTLGALVNFDRWLACAPRSCHEDQMKLHLKMSELSNDYMLPIISYNPWTDIEEGGSSLELVEQAVKAGFVGVKIYPPNGFRPWGNAALPNQKRRPGGREVDEALRKLWLKCQELKVPVMAHAGPSMGQDNFHDLLGGPDSWQALLEAKFWPDGEGPRASLGHFGGDGASSDWTARFSKLMGGARGQRIYGDLGYWEDLRCEVVGRDKCGAAKDRLRAALTMSFANGETVADRVMYGSEWVMLSKEKNCPAYARQLLESIREVSPGSVNQIFGGNASRCFGAASLKLTQA